MEYKIEGSTFPVVICTMQNGETMITESGAMAWMTPNMVMETTSRGGIGKALGRMFAGESLFLNRYTARGTGLIAFASSFPGEILSFDIMPGKDLIVQKTGFLAAEESVELSIHFQKRFGAGVFGGEGFILQRLSGQGKAFVEVDGFCKVYELKASEKLILDTGYLAAMDSTCTMDIKQVSGLKNIVFGGEGLFNTEITGPGKIYIQTQPISNLASALRPYFPSGSSK